MPSHDKFEELCALGVSGELRDEELVEVSEHLKGCSECRALWARFEETYYQLSAAENDDTLPVPIEMVHRFSARARAAGIPVRPQPSTRSEFQSPARVLAGLKLKSITSWGPIMLVALIAISFFFGMRYQAVRHLAQPIRAQESQATAASGTNPLISENLQLKNELRDTRDQLATASAKLRQQQETLESSRQERAFLALQIAQLKKSTLELREDDSNQKIKVEQLGADLEKARARESSAGAASLATELEVAALRDRVAKLSAQLDLARELDATLHEAHDLIVDRNVHVLNVLPEVGAENRYPQPRGRIFYAEGKKLVFYAYDLTANKTKLSFYLWGQAPSAVQKVVSLGKFQIDNEQEARWVLRVTDSRLLAHLDSVFVTEEPYQKTVTRPSGKRMLFRILDTKTSDQ